MIFFLWFRDNPRDHKGVNAGELALLKGAEMNASGHGDVPWKKMLTSRNVWLLWLQYAAASYPWYFYITWLPTYLKESYHLEPQKAAILAGLPLFFGGIGCFFSWLDLTSFDSRVWKRSQDAAHHGRHGLYWRLHDALNVQSVEGPHLGCHPHGLGQFFQ